MRSASPASGVAAVPSAATTLKVAWRRREIRYVAVGAWNTAFAYSVWAVMQTLLQDKLHYLVTLVLAWPIAVANAYVCQRRFVFRSRGQMRHELPRFALVYVGSLGASLVVLPICLTFLPLNIYLVQAAFTVAVVVVTYLLHRSFSFGRPADDEPAELS